MPQEAISLCSWKSTGGSLCGKAATHHYRWEWGEEGDVCPDCIPLMHQTAANLSRTFALTTLDTVNPTGAPVTRHERTQLIAAKLSAEAELEEVQQRGQKLYEANVDLTRQVQTHVMRAREHAAIVDGKDAQIDKLSEQLAGRETELAETGAELQRLKVLVQFAPPPETSRVGSERGLQPEQYHPPSDG